MMLTDDEREAIFKKYDYVKFYFSSYYKYTFTFKGVYNETEIIKISIGGSGDDIYRLDVGRDIPVSIRGADSICIDGEMIDFYQR